MTLAMTTTGDPLAFDLDRLVGTHLCVAASSGGGKSWTIRRLLEITHGHVQHIILDAEDEFYTLRERFEYVIAGGDGADAPAAPENAEALALASLTHGFSLIAQLNDLGEDAPTFISRFLDALISAPRDLWRPVLIVIDEAQRFAPGNGGGATSAIKNLLQRGRKRGFTAILATTRVSELHPGVRGLVNNWMLGLVAQSLDRKTAADQLGFSPSSPEARGMQLLEPKQFWSFGPAMSRLPVLATTSDVQTTHVRPGQAKVATPPAPEALRAILAGLATPAAPPDPVDDPQWKDAVQRQDKAERGKRLGGEIQAIVDLQGQVSDLRGQLEVMEQRAVSAEAIAKPFLEQREALKRFVDAVHRGAEQLNTAFAKMIAQAASEVRSGDRQGGQGDVTGSAERAIKPKSAVSSGAVDTPSPINPIGQSIIANLRLIWPAQITWQQAAQMAGRSPKSGPYFAAKKQLIEHGLVESEGQFVRAAGDNGVGISRAKAVEIWRKVIDGFAPRMLDVLTDDEWRSRDQLGEAMGVSTKSGPWFGGLKTLRERGLIEENGPQLRLARPLPGEAQ